MGEVAEKFDYGLNAAASDFDGVNKYLRITDIDDITHRFIQTDLTSPGIKLDGKNSYLLQNGDICFVRTGASVGKTYKYVADDGKVYFAGFLIRAHVKDNHDADFIYQILQRRSYRDFVSITSMRSGQPGINATEYQSFQLMTPDKPEQSRIGEFFRTLDALIAAQKRKTDLLKRLKRAYLQQLFPTPGHTTPRLRFPGFTDAWEQKKLSSVIQSELKGTAKAEMLGTQSIYLNTNYLNGGSASFVDSPTNVQKDDLLILWDGSQAGTIYYGFSGALGSTLKAYKPKISGLFLYYQLKRNQEIIYKSYRTPNIPHVIKTFTDDFWVSTARIEEQSLIGNFFRTLDTLITTQTQKVTHLEHLKRAYLQKMFV